MKCLLTLEWNSKQRDALSVEYLSLVGGDEGLCFSAGDLPTSLGDARLLLIDIKKQSLTFFDGGGLEKKYQVSTALNGAGCREGSGCTPLGWHRVLNKIGEHQPSGTIFKGRRVCGITDSLVSTRDDDLITSRILWLSGLQPGVNSGGDVDSYSRYIYIHGTAQEHLIGSPVSHGCIRMRNSDVVELFNCVDESAIVFVCHDFVQYSGRN